MSDNQIDLDNLLIEAEVIATMERLTQLASHIKERVPHELLYGDGGTFNVRTRWGAVLHHINLTRATLRAFL